MILILIGLFGFILNRNSVFTILLSLELILMGTITYILSIENIYTTIILVILAGIESLIGLGLLVKYYKC